MWLLAGEREGGSLPTGRWEGGRPEGVETVVAGLAMATQTCGSPETRPYSGLTQELSTLDNSARLPILGKHSLKYTQIILLLQSTYIFTQFA